MATPGPLLELAIDDFERQIAVNLTGQLIVTQAFAPLLGADRSRRGAPGRIVMITSVGGRSATPFMGAYCASKFGLEGLSESLRRELMLFGVDVVVVAPGVVATPIWDKADAIDLAPFANSPYAAALANVKRFMIAMGRNGLAPERIGEVVKTALIAEKPKVRYTVRAPSVQNLMVDVLPKRVLDRVIARRVGLQPEANG